MAKFNTAIADAMDALDDEIAELEGELEKLRETRENLESLLDEEDGDTPTRERKVRKSTVTATDKPKRGRPAGGESTKRARIVRMLQDNVKVSDIADQVGVTPNYVYTIRKDEGLDTGERGKPAVKRSQRSQRAQRTNGDTGKQSRKAIIKRMLNAGDKVKDIADELGIGTGYVYNVQREMNA